MTAYAEELREGLAACGAQLAEADAARAEAMAAISEWVVQADSMGNPVPIAEMARLTGLTRQTIYDILGRAH